ITTRSDEQLIGCCSLRPRNEDTEYEIGYWLGRTWWGSGFATEAVHTLVDFAFTATGLKRLFVSCRVTNSSSRRVIHKSGFQPDGTDMTTSRALGGSVPVECYSLDRATWRSLRHWRREDGYVFS
ncbi:MAG: GNAT family N-acetyltransferase, partial [Hyphomicrobiales bacterium]